MLQCMILPAENNWTNIDFLCCYNSYIFNKQEFICIVIWQHSSLQKKQSFVLNRHIQTNTYACTHIYMQNAHKLTPRAYEYRTELPCPGCHRGAKLFGIQVQSLCLALKLELSTEKSLLQGRPATVRVAKSNRSLLGTRSHTLQFLWGDWKEEGGS